MDIDTGQFQALMEQLARLADRVEDLLVDQTALSAMYQAGREAERAALLGHAPGATPAPKSHRARAQHLQPVDGGASR